MSELTQEQLIALGRIMQMVEEVQANPPEPLYVSGTLDVMSEFGKIGELRTEEDWWMFVPRGDAWVGNQERAEDQ